MGEQEKNKPGQSDIRSPHCWGLGGILRAFYTVSYARSLSDVLQLRGRRDGGFKCLEKLSSRFLAEIDNFGSAGCDERDVFNADDFEDQAQVYGRDVSVLDRRAFGVNTTRGHQNGALGSLRYNEIQRRASGISQRMLTLTLKRLETDGVVTRTLFPSVPPRVDYELTPLGQTLLGALVPLHLWAAKNRETIASNRAHVAAKEKNASHTQNSGETAAF